MNKNLLSILILGLLVVNIILTSIMMFSVTGASKKTSKLVTDIASVLRLELGDEEAETKAVPLSQTEVYNISDSMTVTLRNGEDGNTHYCMVSVALSINTKADGYKEFGSSEVMSSYEPLITGEIINIIGNYTMDELKTREKEAEAKQEILHRIQSMFESEFIYNVSFSDIKFQ
ncbi:flagellar basal body-associated FliL family protein [Kineothrix sp. MB12-C1]|uniref:flagellar basal body-associated FliL family protein n=1 Tax=Kineothrix sp. MB12-C1 TaxID=3070215 RepID=UPI0027D30DF6|nr:flagellar basal body-associated FliL family protein [Kineothrix sp. MB12-C1]WMC93008.1 flagellar basal body-associated FliL family protein [Kineothrix sp. MB12-C1]